MRATGTMVKNAAEAARAIGPLLRTGNHGFASERLDVPRRSRIVSFKALSSPVARRSGRVVESTIARRACEGLAWFIARAAGEDAQAVAGAVWSFVAGPAAPVKGTPVGPMVARGVGIRRWRGGGVDLVFDTATRAKAFVDLVRQEIDATRAADELSGRGFGS